MGEEKRSAGVGAEIGSSPAAGAGAKDRYKGGWMGREGTYR